METKAKQNVVIPPPQGPPASVTSGKIAKALEIRKSTAKAREGKPLAFPTSRRHP
jgi:hypothetical protein